MTPQSEEYWANKRARLIAERQMIVCRWLDTDSDEWHKGFLLGFVPQAPGGIIAMVATHTGRIVQMDYTRLRVGEEFEK